MIDRRRMNWLGFAIMSGAADVVQLDRWANGADGAPAILRAIQVFAFAIGSIGFVGSLLMLARDAPGEG